MNDYINSIRQSHETLINTAKIATSYSNVLKNNAIVSMKQNMPTFELLKQHRFQNYNNIMHLQEVYRPLADVYDQITFSVLRFMPSTNDAQLRLMDAINSVTPFISQSQETELNDIFEIDNAFTRMDESLKVLEDEDISLEAKIALREEMELERRKVRQGYVDKAKIIALVIVIILIVNYAKYYTLQCGNLSDATIFAISETIKSLVSPEFVYNYFKKDENNSDRLGN